MYGSVVQKFAPKSRLIFLICSIALLLSAGSKAEQIKDHEVVLDSRGRLMPWTSYDFVIRTSVNFIKQCPATTTRFGMDPWYLVSSKFKIDASDYYRKQNNQGSNVYYAAETLRKHYAYSGDRDALLPVKLLLDRVLYYCTPADWAWPNVPITQDDNYDGEYTDEWSEPDKMCMVGLGAIIYWKLTAEKGYLEAAVKIAQTVSQHIKPGDEQTPPIPFRVNPRTGQVMDSYTADMVYPIMFFDELLKLGYPGEKGEYHTLRSWLLNWMLNYPMRNNRWSGYYEDVISDRDNLNQQLPMEFARYLMNNPDVDPNPKENVPALIQWVEKRFGQTKHHGATSIREQDTCFQQMSSHTARYASVVAKWFGVTSDPKVREEARAAFALATYTAYNKYSKDGLAINYTGIDYTEPWFSDSYFDYLSHIFDGMAEMPEMAPDNEDHLLKSTSTITQISYGTKCIAYSAFDPEGDEILKITFKPLVFADGKALDKKHWSFGEYRGVPNILLIHREGSLHIVVMDKSSK